MLEQKIGQLKDYPFTPKRFSLKEGYQLSFIEEGTKTSEKPPLVMLHGNPTWSYYYRHLISHFSNTHQVIAPDHLGMGLSDKPQDYRYTLEKRIAHIEELLDSLNLKNTTLIVHDWGGAIGHGLAVKRPDLVGAIISLNTGAFTSLRIPFRIAILKAPILGPWLIRAFNAFAYPATFMAVETKLSKEVKEGFLHPYKNFHDRVAISAFVQDIPLHPKHPSYACLKNIEEKLPSLEKLPKIFIWGEKDFCFSTHFLYRFTHFFPLAKSYIFPDAGHYVLEDKKEEVKVIIQEFLDEYRR